jgi:hypothetical protein
MFATVPDSNINYACHGLFLTCENKQQLILQIGPLNAGIVAQHVGT